MLITEDLGETPNVAAADVDRILPTDSFGKFAVLSASIQRSFRLGTTGSLDLICRASASC
jgi:hypothetical protein